MVNLGSTFPVLPVRNTVLFPNFQLGLTVGRPRSLGALRYAKEHGNLVLVVSQRRTSEGDPSAEDLYAVGTIAKLESLSGSDAQGFHVTVRGLFRFKVSKFALEGDALIAKGEQWLDRQDAEAMTISVLTKNLKELAAEILELGRADDEENMELVARLEDPVQLSHLCCSTLQIPIESKQALLENVSVRDRMEKLLDLLKSQREALKLHHEVKARLSERISREQRRDLLREHLKTIKEELGEGEAKLVENLRRKVAKAGMPEAALDIANEELTRIESLSSSSPELNVIRNYVEWLCAMPWKKADETRLDLNLASEILNADHFGLEKVKDRVLQHLAIMKLKNSLRGPILCFMGPPGVGKTSLGQSIAKALGRKFVRVSLGGVRDESEIRGHRRTYVGAMPGRLIQALKRAGTRNPVILLDEIDKLSTSYQGDPAAALLEVLDPEQNREFTDHYLDVPFDLSDVFFLTTANTPETIPAPLRDRLEMIELNGYTLAEKLQIAKLHLLPKQLSEHGLRPEQVEIEDEALKYLIGSYTHEAGARDLGRKIGAVLRKAGQSIVTSGVSKVRIDHFWIQDALGPEPYIPEVSQKVSSPGVVTGLAWTAQGGDILFVEASSMPGKGELMLTGQLGEVMKESAQIAMSLVRSSLSGERDFSMEKRDFHVHVPAGAIPKDGPSAGVAILSALASLVTRKAIDPKTAMTGEITLRRAVLPVGGIKEKVIAAHRAGITRVLLPKRNEKDLRDVPEDVRSSIEFKFVESTDEVLELVLGRILTSIDYAAPMTSDRGRSSRNDAIA